MRVHLLDVFRGLSVLAMMVYHFFWDLAYFNFIEFQYITNGFPLFIAQCIGASFIIISGISSRLASLSSDYRIKFLRRIGVLILICSLITSLTYFLDKTSFIFFGVLHFLVTCSLISFFLIKTNKGHVLFILFIFSLILSISEIKYDLPNYFAWIGLNEEVPITNDFYPIIPWISFYFFGAWISRPVANYLTKKNRVGYFGIQKLTSIYSGLQFLGRNSLTFYILHQPIFFSLFLIFIRISS